MFRYSEAIENIRAYKAADDQLIYLTKGPKEQESIFVNREFILSNVCSFVNDLNEIIFYTWDLKVYKRTDFGLKLLLEGYSLNEQKYDEETIFVSQKISPGKYVKRLYNIDKEKFIKEVTEVPKIVTDSFEVYYSGSIVKVISRTGADGWLTNLGGRKYRDIDKEKDVTIQRLIGIEKGQLLVVMINEELISLDIVSGHILWETKDFVKSNLPYYSDYRMGMSIFRFGTLENGKLYQLHGNIYYSLDLETQNVEILWEDKSETEYLTCLYSSYTQDYVYFTGSRNNRFSPYLLGAFNRKTLQVDWVHEPKGIVNPLTNVPHYVNGKLYILDSGGILHIYEIE